MRCPKELWFCGELAGSILNIIMEKCLMWTLVFKAWVYV